MDERFRERTVRALTWSVSGRVAGQAISFVFGIALARLLGPRDFGLLAMVAVLVEFASSIADLGFEEALVQRRELEEVHRSSVFWTLLLLGGALSAATLLAAPWIARFYGVPELRQLAAWISLVFVLRALGTVPRALIARRLDFRTITRIECVAAAAGGVCGLALAWRGYGVVSLVVQLLVGEGLGSLLLLQAGRWRPHRALRSRALGDLLGFGVYRIATRALGYWSQHIDDLLVGRFLGGSPLGLYNRAFALMRFPVYSVSRAIARATFPSLSLIQDDRERVRSVYLRISGAVALATVPMCLGLLACAEPLVVGLLGPKWRGAVPLLRILSAAGVLQSVATLSSSVYLSQGRTDLHLRLNLFQNLLTTAGVASGLRWGVTGVAVGYAAANVVNVLPSLLFAGRLVDLPLVRFAAHVAPPFVAGAAMLAAVLALDAALPALPELARLALEVPLGVGVYGVAVRLLAPPAYFDVRDALRRGLHL
jgi:O-antigen/teichoic acid export membrane protein